MDGVIYDITGSRGRRLIVFEDKVIIKTSVTPGSILTGNFSDGEKTIYYADCIGIQFKESGMQLGYLQLETASALMNNRASNFFNENSFTFEGSVLNSQMKEVADYIRIKVEECKKQKSGQTVAVSAADELKKFKERLDSGVITQEVFDATKKQLWGLYFIHSAGAGFLPPRAVFAPLMRGGLKTALHPPLPPWRGSI